MQSEVVLPEGITESVRPVNAVKVAVTLRAADIAIVQLALLPLQSPLKLVKPNPKPGVAVSTTEVAVE